MEAGEALSPQTCLYLYAVLPASQHDLRGVQGLDGGSEVFLVRCEDLSCAASEVPAADYAKELPRDIQAQLEWLGPRALRHDEVIRELSQSATLVPLKFGTLCSTPQAVQDMLTRWRAPLLQLLRHFEGKQEWAVRVFADGAAVLRSVEEQDGELREMEDAAARMSPGQAYFARKKKQARASSLMDEQLASLAEDIFARLLLCAADAVRSTSSSPAPGPDSVNVLTAAVLVPEAKFAELEVELGQIESENARYGVAVELQGPWPPYNFCAEIEEFHPQKQSR